METLALCGSYGLQCLLLVQTLTTKHRKENADMIKFTSSFKTNYNLKASSPNTLNNFIENHILLNILAILMLQWQNVLEKKTWYFFFSFMVSLLDKYTMCFTEITIPEINVFVRPLFPCRVSHTGTLYFLALISIPLSQLSAFFWNYSTRWNYLDYCYHWW